MLKTSKRIEVLKCESNTMRIMMTENNDMMLDYPYTMSEVDDLDGSLLSEHFDGEHCGRCQNEIDLKLKYFDGPKAMIAVIACSLCGNAIEFECDQRNLEILKNNMLGAVLVNHY